ncbi:hypothetical protein [uncultured Roseibium sp.]|uniref:hypothetical protein n=1 Tax=uncultured Roseibium sp. TaxID=1936171 RepID=UPI002627A9C6|nr:hypothetical protein [uncultured Roseibium sp.]
MTRLKHFASAMVLIVSIIAPAPAQACRLISSETQTFLNYLPITAVNEEVIALVSIEERSVSYDKPFLKVKVVKSIAGVSTGQLLNVAWERHSCSRDRDVTTGKMYFIAGSIDRNNLFRGEWKNIPLFAIYARGQPSKVP